MKINIPFRGISNVPDDSYSKDGEMAVVMNMRHKGGELVECRPPTVEINDAVKTLYHAQSGKWLDLSDDHDLFVRGELEPLATGVLSFSVMGNVVMMQYDNRVEYAIWEGVYRVLGALPEIGDNFSVSFTNESELAKEDSYFNLGNNVSTIRNTQVGAINKLLNAIYEEKGFVDRVWFKIAFRLFDGTYIRSSNIIQASWYEEWGQDVTPGVSNGTKDIWYLGENDVYKARVNYFKVAISIKDALFDRLKGWENIITSVDVFTTGSIMSFGLVKTVNGSNVYEEYKTLDQKGFYDIVANLSFYKMAEYSTNGSLHWEVENTSPSNLAVQTQLIEESHDLYIPKQSGVYNKRLHIFDYKKKLFNGYSFPKAIFADGSSLNYIDGDFVIVVFLKTEDGEKVVVKPISYRDRYVNLHYYSYPDSRAYKMIIINDGIYDEILLDPHPFKNEAFAIKVEMWQNMDGKMIPSLYNPGKGIAPLDYEVDDIENVKDILKVSAVDNPFYLPTAQTYKFEGDIVALSSNAEAISTGQFGQFPLFVFTTEGIWAMSVDTSGKGAYLAQSPFSREVCSGSVCPLSGGVAFTTERGVMLISGGQVTELTENLDGLAVDFMEYQADTWEKIFERAEMDYYVQPVPIQEYVKGAKLAYNYKHNELMLSNYAFPFTYVLNLKDGTWGMIDTTFDLTTNKYPECVVHNSEKGERYVFEDADGRDVRVVAVTRPVKVETLDFKRIRQAALRCTFIGKLNFYVLGSNDGARFVCITGKEYPSVNGNEPTDVMRRDLITSAARSKQYKYISVVVAGVMRGRVSLAEMLVEGGFASNQLR